MESTTVGGFSVSPLGLGTSRMASMGSGRSRKDASYLLDAALDLGINLIDTADTYGSTACERWLGDLMRTRALRFVISTKSGLTTADLPGPLRALNQPVKKVMQRAGHIHYLQPSHVKRSIDASLKRLRRDRIELYFLHSPPSGLESSDELFGVLDEAQRAGKIGAYGISSPDIDVIVAVTAARNCRVAQTAVNPLTMSETGTVLGQHSVELIANHVLPPTLMNADAAQSSQPGVAELSRRLRELSNDSGLSYAQLLLRHAAAAPHVRVVLTGTSKLQHLAENAAALAQPLSTADLIA